MGRRRRLGRDCRRFCNEWRLPIDDLRWGQLNHYAIKPFKPARLAGVLHTSGANEELELAMHVAGDGVLRSVAAS